jgi:hypothetical protein
VIGRSIRLMCQGYVTNYGTILNRCDVYETFATMGRGVPLW